MNKYKSNLKEKLRLYAITDSKLFGDRIASNCVEQALIGKITMLQYREKHLQGEALVNEAKILKGICNKYDVPFIINDNVYLAKEIGADGVHLGASDMDIIEAKKILGDDFIIGATAKTIEQAKIAKEAGADYLGSGAVFGTVTKLDAKPMDRETLKAIVKSVDIPVVAIGGINEENVLELEGTGIIGVAVISGIFGSDDIENTTKNMAKKVNQVLGEING